MASRYTYTEDIERQRYWVECKIKKELRLVADAIIDKVIWNGCALWLTYIYNMVCASAVYSASKRRTALSTFSIFLSASQMSLTSSVSCTVT